MKNSFLYVIVLLMTFMLIGCSQSQLPNLKAMSKNEQEKAQTSGDSTEKKGDVEMAVYPQLTTEVADNEKLVQMNTNMGAIKIKLFPEQAPKTVENFVTHA